jgi:hypothetical protein
MKLLSFLLAAACIPAAVNAATLTGSQVTATVDSPVLGNARSVSVTKTVGPDVEFPEGTLELLSAGVPSGVFIIGVNINVGADTIDLNYTQFATATTASFNGYVFDTSSDAPAITGVSLDAMSSFTASQVPLGFTAHQVTVNVEGLSFGPRSRILVDLDFAGAGPGPSSVPEPSSYGLAFLGVAVLRIVKR